MQSVPNDHKVSATKYTNGSWQALFTIHIGTLGTRGTQKHSFWRTKVPSLPRQWEEAQGAVWETRASWFRAVLLSSWKAEGRDDMMKWRNPAVKILPAEKTHVLSPGKENEMGIQYQGGIW